MITIDGSEGEGGGQILRECAVESITTSPGPGNVLMLEWEAEHATAVFTGFGERGLAAEDVARRTVVAAKSWLAADVPVESAAELNTRTYSNRYAAHVLKQHQFNALCALRGWRNHPKSTCPQMISLLKHRGSVSSHAQTV